MAFSLRSFNKSTREHGFVSPEKGGCLTAWGAWREEKKGINSIAVESILTLCLWSHSVYLGTQEAQRPGSRGRMGVSFTCILLCPNGSLQLSPPCMAGHHSSTPEAPAEVCSPPLHPRPLPLTLLIIFSLSLPRILIGLWMKRSNV